MTTKQQRKQQWIFLMVVLVAILTGVLAALYFGGFKVGDYSASGDGAKGSAGVRYSTMADAQLICQERAREVFDARIRTLVVDSFSSRQDKKAGLFRVFLESDLYADEKRQGATTRHYISCTTRVDRVAIANFQFAKEGGAMQEPGSSVFGF
jgi:hypothetical protein